MANGAVLSCTAELPDCVWTTQGHVFYTTFKILALTNYDAILGMDWLMQCSPMSVDWVQKSLVICWQGKSVTLQGIVPELQQCQMISTQQLKEFDDRRAVAHFVQLCSLDDKESSEQIPVKIQHVLQEFASVFDEPMGLPPTQSFDHTIPLIPGAVPVNVRPYRYTPAQKDEIEQQVREMLDKGIIQPSSSPFSSPVLLVKKKDGTWRFCVDYRHLNAITVKNKYPLPIIDELLDELSRAQWFTKLDLRAGYHQIRMKMSDEHKTAFKTHSGHYEFRVIPFGLTSAPATFQGGMNSILSPLLRRCVLVFVDDILIYSATLEDHVNHLRQLFQILVKHQLKVKQSKCSFAQQRLSYLGHIITPNGVSTDDDKIRVVQNWPVPGSVKELRSFLGLTGYYRKFVCHYGILSKPLTNLLRKGQLYIWTSETEAAFQALKQALITAPVLAMPNFSEPFIVETDASDKGIGAVLMQHQHPIAFLSKALGPRHQGLSTYEKKSLAIMLAVEHWRPYLQHAEFFIRTDHRSLSFLDDQRLTTPWQHKALTKLLGLRYKIIYKKGTDNGAADALSRYPSSATLELSALSVAVPDWIQEVVSGYSLDPDACSKVQTLCISASAVPNFSLRNGVLYFKDRIWIGTNTAVQQKILANLHTTAVGGHSGIHVTYHRVKQLFAWPRLRSTVTQLRMSSSYYPPTDGQTEHVNQCLETFLRCFVHACPSHWSKWLALAEYWYNTSFHSALGSTPFEVLYGHKPRYFGLTATTACQSTELADCFMSERKCKL
uniref:Polyprotein n=1 Tax=Oryza sativa subsp. japonica TaxID=39947 RepID=Q8W151_ORYSJ|nr:polyprotein [Oryza sativa Japonica Group]